MGYELNKLMTQYGLATPTMLSYDGERGPDVENHQRRNRRSNDNSG